MIFTPFSAINLQSILEPNGPAGWLAWLSLLVLVVWRAWRGKPAWAEWTRQQWILLAVLTLLTVLLQFLLVFRLPLGDALPIPGANSLTVGPLMPLLAAVPWMLASAVLGSLPGAILGAISGVVLAALDTHSPFTVLEFALLATLFGTVLRQGYRTPFFALLRKPWIAALLLAAVYPLLYVFNAFFWSGDNLVASLDFALSRLYWVSLGLALQVLIGGLIIEALASRGLLNVPGRQANQPSPAERSLKARFFSVLGPVLIVFFLALGAIVWVVAGRAARQMLTERLLTSSSVAARGVPFLLETGQSLILQLASNPALLGSNNFELTRQLEVHLGSLPYYEQYFLLDRNGDTLAGYPVANFEGVQPGPTELEAIERAFAGVALQFFSIPPLDPSSDAAQLSFVAAVNDGSEVRAVLLGRSQLNTNPFAQPILDNLKSLTEIGGQGLLLDGDGQIVYQPGGEDLLALYTGSAFEGANLYEDIGPDGARRLVLYEPAIGSEWSVVLQLPASLIQQLALDIALPIFAILILMALLAYWLLARNLRTVSASLQDLVLKSQRIASGDLDTAIETHHEDEVGRLGKSFERMRKTLKTRLDENLRLLSVSQGIASSLEMSSQIEPILEAALASGADMARLVFREEAVAEGEELQNFGRGENNQAYQLLDAQLLALADKRKLVLLTNPARAGLDFGEAIVPQALAAFALQHEGKQLGVLWLAYNQAQDFGDEALRYLQTLANQAASATMNASQYLQAEEGRQRLEALIETLPDPVFLISQDGLLLIANLATQNLLGKSSESLLGAKIQDVIEHAGLLQLLLSSLGETPSIELNFDDGRTFSASLREIGLESDWRGRVCILREMTELRQTEAMRSEFLSTTSHELLDPLELIGGYLTMLDMVGNLNEKQDEYLLKTKQSIVGMSQLVNSLLDLERIDSVKGLQLETFSIVEAINKVIAEINPRAVQKSVKIELVTREEAAPMLVADSTLLQRALYNLMDNGIKNSARGGKVEIGLQVSSNAVTIVVRDYGAGIAQMDLPFVFDRISTESAEGEMGRDGIGLAIVKSIFERHNGQVWAESDLGVGSTFYGQLPLQQED